LLINTGSRPELSRARQLPGLHLFDATHADIVAEIRGAGLEI
jgi:hypothetical protein